MTATKLVFYQSLSKCRPARAVLVYLVLQQVLVASSTYWLALLMARVASQQNTLWYLCCFLASMLLPYIPGSLALIQLSDWQWKAFEIFLNRFKDSNHARVSTWNSQQNKDRATSTLAAEAQNILNRILENAYRFFALGLNTVLNAIAVSWVVDATFGLVYMLSILLAFLFFKKLSARQKTYTLEAQQSRIRTSEQLFGAWDNVLIGNRYNFLLWEQQLRGLFQKAEKNSRKLVVFSQKMSVSVALVTLLPCMGLLAYRVGFGSMRVAETATMVVLLPRLFMVLVYTQEFFSLGIALRESDTKLNAILNGIKTEALRIENRICLEKISFERDGGKVFCNHLDDVLVLVQKPGRICIKGENGSGKSSLLLWMKERLGSEGFYLPPKHSLIFASSTELASTGQRFYRNLNETLESAGASVLLLDEWSANLDASRILEMDEKIDAAAKNIAVIEVRHHVGELHVSKKTLPG